MEPERAGLPGVDAMHGRLGGQDEALGALSDGDDSAAQPEPAGSEALGDDEGERVLGRHRRLVAGQGCGEHAGARLEPSRLAVGDLGHHGAGLVGDLGALGRARVLQDADNQGADVGGRALPVGDLQRVGEIEQERLRRLVDEPAEVGDAVAGGGSLPGREAPARHERGGIAPALRPIVPTTVPRVKRGLLARPL
ncbi:MAG TPA: hypothetical protein VK975_01450 [Acidimicrobiales bacterium]|nr:hypothetical protein [Acidimicrobiales bacterium]